MKNFFHHYRWELGIMALAFALRVPQLFRMDFAYSPEFFRDYYVMEKIMSGHWPLLGPPAMQANFSFGPVYYYFYAPLFFLSHFHPASLILTGILFYSFSAVIFYRLLLLWLKDQKSAAFGAIFYAISIYGIYLTSYVSNPNFLPFWVLLYYYLISKIIEEEPNYKNFIILGLAFGIAAQLHTTAAIALTLSSTPLFVYYVLPKVFRAKKPAVILASILAVIFSAAPYIYFELTNGFLNLRNFFSFGAGHFRLEKHNFAFEKISDFFQTSLNPFYLGNSYSAIQPPLLYLLLGLAAIIILISLLMSLNKRRNSSQEIKNFLPFYACLLMAGWFLAAFASIVFFNKSPHPYYFIIFWPLPAIFLAAASFWIRTRLGIFKSIVLFFCLASALQIFTFYNHPATSWKYFDAIYQKYYKNDPDTPQIGSEKVGWPQGIPRGLQQTDFSQLP